MNVARIKELQTIIADACAEMVGLMALDATADGSAVEILTGLGVGARGINCLIAEFGENVRMSDLIGKSDIEFLKIPNVGKKQLAEYREAFSQYLK